MTADLADVTSDGLRFTRPDAADLTGLYAILSDPRVWWHFPTLRHVRIEQTRTLIGALQASWEATGLGAWTVRSRGAVVGLGGCSDLRGVAWNLGYRIAADAQGNGYATILARAGMDAARSVDPDRPVVAYLVAHNTPSARLAEKLGLALVHRGPDAGNPDPEIERLVYADRPLTRPQLAAAMR